MKTDETLYIFDDQIAVRLHGLAVALAAAIEELLARTKVEPIVDPEVPGEAEMGFWETEAALQAKLAENDPPY